MKRVACCAHAHMPPAGMYQAAHASCCCDCMSYTTYKCRHGWHDTGPSPQSGHRVLARKVAVCDSATHSTIPCVVQCGTVPTNCLRRIPGPLTVVSHMSLNDSHLTRCFTHPHISTSRQSSASGHTQQYSSLVTLARTHKRPGTAQHSTVCAHGSTVHTTKHSTAQSGADAAS
jgi:hypothetical protein